VEVRVRVGVGVGVEVNVLVGRGVSVGIGIPLVPQPVRNSTQATNNVETNLQCVTFSSNRQ